MVTEADKEKLKEFGEKLKKIRKDKALSLRRLSYLCSIDYSDIGKMERGKTNITLLTLFELADALEVDPSELIKDLPFNTVNR
ncbi:MAG: helix-turn-helix transcriptional regulator [Chitinophagaceae bacterium]